MGAAEKTLLVQLTADQLRDLIRDSVRAELKAANTHIEALLNTEQAAKVLNTTPRNVRYLADKGMPYLMVENHYRFRRKEIEEWAAKNKQTRRSK